MDIKEQNKRYKKRMDKIICGAALVTERYGGGSRYHCPDCEPPRCWDTGTALWQTWTNGMPPKEGKCLNKVTRK